MKLTITDKKLKIADLEAAIKLHVDDNKKKMHLKAYYKGEHEILKKQGRVLNAPNNRLVANYCAYISNISTGFFLGNPVSYIAVDEQEQDLEALIKVLKENDETAHNLELAEEASITGVAYEVLFLDEEGEISFLQVPSEEIVLFTDGTLNNKTLYALRHYKIKNLTGDPTEYIDVYDRKNITHYIIDSGQIRKINEKPHFFEDVPIIEYKNNKEEKGDFESVVSLVDAYNKAQSLTLDDMEDFTDAYLVLAGMGGTDENDIKRLRQNKVITLDDGGKADWLIKNLNDTYIENVKTRLQKDIHKLSNIPDLTDEHFASNASGIAIKYKLIGLEQIRSRKERCFKKALYTRMKLIAGVLKLKYNIDLNYRGIDIIFNSNIPSNTIEQANIVKSLIGVVSHKKLLSLLPFIGNPSEELEELKHENEEE